MPKRVKTPPPADDEPKYLSVVHPYPKTHPNMELDHDQIRFCFWLACVIGGNPRLHDYPLRAFYYRPKSGGTIIIEVSRDFDAWNSLLGKHQWSEFLTKPTTEERDKHSSIFYCTYNRGRDVQKSGWKRVDFQSGWFNNEWSAHNEKIRWPYPRTGWCELPKANMNDPNQPQLCRPLPSKDFKPPPKAPIPPVGSPAWHEWKRTGIVPAGPKQKQAPVTTPAPAPAPAGAWGQGKPRSSQAASASARPTASSPADDPWNVPPPGLTSHLGPPPGLGSQSLKAPTPELSSGSSTSSSGHTDHSGVKQPVPQVPGTRFNWAEDVEHESQFGAASYGDSSIAGGAPSSRGVSHSSYITSPDDVDDEAGTDEEDDDGMLKVTSVVASKMRRMNLGSAAPVASSIIQAPIGAPHDDEEPPENLWADANEPKTQVLPWRGNCPEHGPVCPKGICKVYKAMKKQAEREKREAEEAKNGTSARGGHGRGKPRDRKPKPSERENWVRPAFQPQDRSQSSGRSSGSSLAPNPSTSSASTAPAAASARPSRPAGAPGWDNQPSDEWSNWGGDDDNKSVASSARTAWGNSGGNEDDDARSVASAATQRTQATSNGWGNVSVSGMPWGQPAPAAKNAPTRGRPVEDDDAHSVASAATRQSQSTTGWSSVDVNAMPWGQPAPNNASVRGSARGGARGNARGARGGNAWGYRGRGGGRGGVRGGSTPAGARSATTQSPPVHNPWAMSEGNTDDWGPPKQSSEPW